VHAPTVVSTTSAPLHGFAVEQGIECKPEPIMLQNLPIILSKNFTNNSPIILKNYSHSSENQCIAKGH